MEDDSTQEIHTADHSCNRMRQVCRIDGSQGEGGGQILRNSIAYAGILEKGLHVVQIRAKRSQPGLKAQHAVGLQLSANVCGGHLEGATVGSNEITYEAGSNGSIVNRQKEIPTFRGEIPTAGSICLLLQAALPCAHCG